MNNVRVRELLMEIQDAESQLTKAKGSLASIRSTCRHQWTLIKYDPIVREGYQFPGDPEGTMGVDRQLPMWVPREEKARWSRTCTECGLTEATERTKDKVEKVPVF